MEYHGAGLHFRDGDTAEVTDPVLAERLQRDFPGQFFPLNVVMADSRSLDEAPVDRSIKSPRGGSDKRFRSK